ncbi:hypothetical protein O181_011002 [Austropuccinia psidii MF-1]|uniref:Uncharacterized protein n=1 Tax=Austropuccinia psidii MF-1 TaxID=1389203 RepID=A0A9Q3BUV7_9BASI|nr:hypothetical protein [Austropuccinia psidii MF-1]
MIAPFLGPFTIIRLVGNHAVEVRLTLAFSSKTSVFPISLVTPYHQKDDKKLPNRKNIITHEKLVEDDDLPGSVKKIIKAGE